MHFSLFMGGALLLGLAPHAAAQEAPSTAAQAPAQTQVASGASVYGSDGAAIGTVAQVEGDVVIMDVDGRAVPIPATAIAQGPNGATINITKTALVAQFDQQLAAYQAKVDAALTAGAAVQTGDGQSLGTVQEVSAEAVLIESADGPINVPRQLIALDDGDALIVRATLAQIKDAMQAAAPSGR